MTLGEHFEAIERKLDLLLRLVERPSECDSLDWASEMDETQKLLSKVEQRLSGSLPRSSHSSRAPAARRC